MHFLLAVLLTVELLASPSIPTTGKLEISEIEDVQIDFSSPKIDNEFSKSNPKYKERAGFSYERDNLGQSTEFLIEICEVRNEALYPHLMQYIRAYIYDFTEWTMRSNGNVTTEKAAELKGTLRAVSYTHLTLPTTPYV